MQLFLFSTNVWKTITEYNKYIIKFAGQPLKIWMET